MSTAPAATLTNRHARWLVEQHDTCALTFAETADGTHVHVQAPTYNAPARADKSATLMVCGTRLTLHAGVPGKGARRVTSFDNERLCQRCRRAFGALAETIFEPDRRPQRHEEKTMIECDTGDGPADGQPAADRREYLIHFERIGRTHDITLHTHARDMADLADQIGAHARTFLASHDIEVTIDEAHGKGRVFAGVQLGGTFTFADHTDQHTPDSGS